VNHIFHIAAIQCVFPVCNFEQLLLIGVLIAPGEIIERNVGPGCVLCVLNCYGPAWPPDPSPSRSTVSTERTMHAKGGRL